MIEGNRFRRPYALRTGAAVAFTLLAAGCVGTPSGSHAQKAEVVPPTAFVTLGTMGGPFSNPTRSQPANVLLDGRDAYLVDVGDGAVQQLTKAGVRLPQVKAVFISHLHFDHTGGLGAFLGLRYQTSVPGELTIYGPPGTRELVNGLIASERPGAEAGMGLADAPKADPAAGIQVVEMVQDSSTALGHMTVRAAENTHYSYAPGSPEAARSKSLSFRFDLPGRSIVYTGDTGPSDAVEKLAVGTNLLVSEMIDVPATLANVRANNGTMPEPALAILRQHLIEHHLTPTDVGLMAARAKVKEVVVTHIVPGDATSETYERYRREIAKAFTGKITISKDLDRF